MREKTTMRMLKGYARSSHDAVSHDPRALREKLGICQWFHFEDYAAVEKTVAARREPGMTHLRTGISWADFFRPGGADWYRWQMNQLREFELLHSIWHTPPSTSEGGTCNSPPKRLRDFADFIDTIINEFGRPGA